MISRLLGLFLGMASVVGAQSIKAKASDVIVPGGVFQPVFKDKGDELSVVSKLLVNSTAVTNKQFLIFVKSNPEWSKSRVKSLFADDSYLKSWQSDLSFSAALANAPVVYVSWFAARAFCRAKNQRLPTINEWEFLADTTNPLVEADVLKWLSQGPSALKAVNTFKPNKYGVRGAVGSTWEWVDDFVSAIVSEDSRTGSRGDFFCGGAALKTKDPTKYAAFMRYAFRSSLKARYTASTLGFRCVETFVGEKK